MAPFVQNVPRHMMVRVTIVQRVPFVMMGTHPQMVVVLVQMIFHGQLLEIHRSIIVINHVPPTVTLEQANVVFIKQQNGTILYPALITTRIH